MYNRIRVQQPTGKEDVNEAREYAERFKKEFVAALPGDLLKKLEVDPLDVRIKKITTSIIEGSKAQ